MGDHHQEPGSRRRVRDPNCALPADGGAANAAHPQTRTLCPQRAPAPLTSRHSQILADACHHGEGITPGLPTQRA
eukprot:14225562-Alexandrium_andersonii.AAC.1